MKRIQKIALSSIALFALIGCNDTYNKDTKKSELQSSTRMIKHLVDTNKMSLYVFDKDGLNQRNCDAECQKIWPLFEGANSGSKDIKVLKSTDHLAYRKHPLYYFANDKAPGDILGNNMKNVWHLIFAPEGTTDTQTTLSDAIITQTYLTDKDGRSLYTFDKDTSNVSNCYDTSPTSGKGCETIWPVFYTSNLTALPTEMNSADFGTIDRDATRAKSGESLKQTTYKGKPLYYFTPDAKTAGVTQGDWVKGVWHLVELSSSKTGTPSPSTPSTGNTSAVEKGRKIFTNPAKCSRCHGADGQTPPLGVDNVIARYGDATLISQKLKDMRNNGNPQGRNDIMVGVAKKLSDEAITNLSAFIAILKK